MNKITCTRTFEILSSNTYTIYPHWDALDASQRDSCYEQGYDEDNTHFWFDEDGVAFCLREDLKPLEGVFDLFNGSWQYSLFAYQNSYLARLNQENGSYVSITIAEIINV